jgi:hypothetical protein
MVLIQSLEVLLFRLVEVREAPTLAADCQEALAVATQEIQPHFPLGLLVKEMRVEMPSQTEE